MSFYNNTYTHRITGEEKTKQEIATDLSKFVKSFIVRCFRSRANMWIAVTKDGKIYTVISKPKFENDGGDRTYKVIAVQSVPRFNRFEDRKSRSIVKAAKEAGTIQ